MKRILLLAITATVLFTGCASNKKLAEAANINWGERIGTYTYEEAVTDLGKPTLSGESSEGTTAEWVLRKSPRMSLGFGVGGGSFGSHSGVGVGVGTDVSPPAHGENLRLKFGKDGKLLEWTKVKY